MKGPAPAQDRAAFGDRCPGCEEPAAPGPPRAGRLDRRNARQEKRMTSGGNERAGAAASLTGDVTDSGVFRAVLDGYDAVYDALPRSETFSRLWRTHAYRNEFPEQFAHIGFLTVPDAPGMKRAVH